MYPQGVCRIRKPAYAGNGCAIFLVFQTEEVGQKDGCGSQTQLRGVALILIRKASPEGAACFVIYKERNHKTSLI